MARDASLPKEIIAMDGLSEHRPARPVALSEHRKSGPSQNKGYSVERDGELYAGTHVLIDLWDGSDFDDAKIIENALRAAVEACGATLLHIHLHEFSVNGGISGVAVLAESHISVHTWPEFNFAAFDVFMCGDCDPLKAVPVLKRTFAPKRVEVVEQMRGRHG